MRRIEWRRLPGAFAKPRRLQVQRSKDGLYFCPIDFCDHNGFLSQRGCRKHTKTKHGWYFYFDKKPKTGDDPIKAKSNKFCSPDRRQKQQKVLSFSTSTIVAAEFQYWLESTAGGGKAKSQAAQVCSRAMKFLRFCYEDNSDEDDVTTQMVDYCLGSANLICQFLDAMENDWKLGHSGRLSYLNALHDLIDFRKFSRSPGNVLCDFAITDIYIKRAKRLVSRNMRVQWIHDVDSLEGKGNWASIEELQTVIPFHREHFEDILNRCKESPSSILSSELTFATRYLAVFLFIEVKGTRPMTYQYLTVDMCEKAKSNGGFVDQTTFKTTKTYGFDSFILDVKSIALIDEYIKYIRPLLNPLCDFLLVNRNGLQFSKLTDLMSKLVYDAIGKYIHPTRYRQIIETASSHKLSPHEQFWLSEDQKHSSTVARVHYKKLRSRDVARKGQECMRKLRSMTLQDSSTDDSVSDDSSASHNATQNAEDIVDTLPEMSAMSGSGKEFCNPKKRLKFTEEEDASLVKGINKYGIGRWKQMLRDPDINFNLCRTSDTLIKRAIARHLIKRKSR